MEETLLKANGPVFHPLKLAKKTQLTKSVYLMVPDIPDHLRAQYRFSAGQFVRLRFNFEGRERVADYSIVSAPYEAEVRFAIKAGRVGSLSHFLVQNIKEGDIIDLSEPMGRFTLPLKPGEHRTILGFAAGIGITPILSQLKTILFNEKRTRFYLFYGNKSGEETAFRDELNLLCQAYPERLFVHYFFSESKVPSLFSGRLDGKKLNLIINQILHTDDTDPENTVWDNVDEVLLCGPAEMVKTLASTAYKNGIPKKNIHFELFEELNGEIFPKEKALPVIEGVDIAFRLNGILHHAVLPDNRAYILDALLAQGFDIPYSCKAGLCGTCMCNVVAGKAETIDNEYLTDREEQAGKVLSCRALALSQSLELNFDDL